MNSNLDYLIELINFNFQGSKQNSPNVLPYDHILWNQTQVLILFYTGSLCIFQTSDTNDDNFAEIPFYECQGKHASGNIFEDLNFP